MMKQGIDHSSVSTRNTLNKGIGNLTRATEEQFMPQNLRFTLYNFNNNSRAYITPHKQDNCKFMLGGIRKREL
jgi:hypothetical protein